MTTSEFLRAGFLASALGAVLLASSCASPEYAGITADPETNHPISVSPTMKNLELAFTTPAAGLLPDDEMRLAEFVRRYLASGNGAISVSVPKGPDSSAAIHYFGEKLAEMGVAPSKILVGTTANADARVKLEFVTYRADVAPCAWTVDVGNTWSNLPTPNLGCATQHNIAAMVADPRDLVAERSMGAGDATRRDAVIGKYEQGQTTSAQKTADQSGAVTSIK